MTAIPDDLPRLLAEDACAVFWWAFRMRMPRAQQIEEVEKALRKRLAEPLEQREPPHADGGADIVMQHRDIRA